MFNEGRQKENLSLNHRKLLSHKPEELLRSLEQQVKNLEAKKPFSSKIASLSLTARPSTEKHSRLATRKTLQQLELRRLSSFGKECTALQKVNGTTQKLFERPSRTATTTRS